MRGPSASLFTFVLAFVLALPGALPPGAQAEVSAGPRAAAPPGPVANFSGMVGRLVDLVAAAGGGLLSLVWARVALSWFSNDVTKKVQAKDRARDALIGTLVFTAAISGLAWALAQWVVGGS